MNPHASVLLGTLTLVWGLWVLNPIVDTFTRAAIYTKALTFAPEWAWGAWSVAFGLFVIISLYYGNAKVLARALGFTTWHWAAVSVMVWWGEWENTAGLVYMFIAFYSMVAFLNVRVNYINQKITHI